MIKNLAGELRENPRGSEIVSDPILSNIGSLTISDPRGFGALCMPNFESRSVYLEKPEDFNPKAEVVGCCFLHYQDKILLLHRQDFKAEGNRWGIPGGKLNKNELVLEAIVREVFEETGFQLDREKIHSIGKVYIKVPNFDFEYHMVKYDENIKNPGEVRINFKEHKGFTWVTPKEALKMNLITDEDICFEIVFGLDRS